MRAETGERAFARVSRHGNETLIFICLSAPEIRGTTTRLEFLSFAAVAAENGSYGSGKRWCQWWWRWRWQVVQAVTLLVAVVA